MGDTPNTATETTTALPAPAAGPLQGPVSTGKDNVFQTNPFDVILARSPEKWNPAKERLPVEYTIIDPNARAEFGRIVYLTPPSPAADGTIIGPTLVHIQSLQPDQITNGRHELPPIQRWDGVIASVPHPRMGSRVGFADGPIRVLIQVWNRDATPPPIAEDETSSPVPRHVSRDQTDVRIDSILEARWDRTWVVPYDDPEEPEHGEAYMHIRVQNVPDGTPVRLYVERIGDPEQVVSRDNKPYALTGHDPAGQPGLEGAVVRGGRVVLPNGKPPFVRFNLYQEHWAYEGNNFYAFHVAFGERGRFQPASQRDYVHHEKDCLHMRFTVFIHRPAGDLGYSKSSARKLHRFLRDETKYFRSYLMEGAPKDAQQWVRYWRHRYIVVVVCHAACFCSHPDHPRKKKNPDEFMEMWHRGFVPDVNACPKELELAGFFTIEEDLKKYKQEWFDGCGNKSHVTQWSGLGRLDSDEKFVVYNSVNVPEQRLICSRQKLEPRDPKDRHKKRNWLEAEAVPLDPDDFPRLMFYNGGCRTMLTTNFGEPLIEAGTRYHCGWIYSVLDEVDGRMCPEFFKRWIKGTKKDPAPVEFDADRVPDVFRAVAALGEAPDWHPRIMDGNGVLNVRKEPDAVFRSLQ